MMSSIYQQDQNEVNDDDKDDKEERRHFHRVINAFRCYRRYSLRRIAISEHYFMEMPEHHKAMLPNFMKSRKALRQCVDANYEVLKEIISNTNQMFVNKDHGPLEEEHNLHVSEFDLDRVITTLKQITRDWSSEGKAERDACYTPVLEEITARFPKDKFEPENISVLVPGAGIGRLAFEIAQHGYQTQGNEFSFFMLFTSNFILNRCKETNIFTLYPWIHQYCNNKKTEDQRHPVHFPDINPAELSSNADFSMTAGDFLEVYTEKDVWDCVATVYFIDTAHNIIAYIEAIYKILKPGGIWVNFGPLLYHFAEIANESSIELSYEEVRKIIKMCNFTLLKEQTDMKSTYTQNPRSMLQYEYNCIFFVAQKPYTNC